MLELERIKQSIIFLSSEISDLYFTKLLKLLYYFDFISVLETGKPITNDVYYKLPFGPVPSFIKDQLNLLRKESKAQEKELFSAQRDDFFKSIFEDCIELSLDKKTSGFLVKSKTTSDYNYLSDYEKKLLKDITDEFKGKSTTDLVEKTHLEPPYLQTAPNNVIDYKLAFYLDRNSILPKRTHQFNVEVSQMEYTDR